MKPIFALICLLALAACGGAPTTPGPNYPATNVAAAATSTAAAATITSASVTHVAAATDIANAESTSAAARVTQTAAAAGIQHAEATITSAKATIVSVPTPTPTPTVPDGFLKLSGTVTVPLSMGDTLWLEPLKVNGVQAASWVLVNKNGEAEHGEVIDPNLTFNWDDQLNGTKKITVRFIDGEFYYKIEERIPGVSTPEPIPKEWVYPETTF